MRQVIGLEMRPLHVSMISAVVISLMVVVVVVVVLLLLLLVLSCPNEPLMRPRRSWIARRRIDEATW